MNIYRFYVPEQFEGLVEKEMLDTERELNRTNRQSIKHGLNVVWKWDWVGEGLDGVRVGLLVVEMYWPAVKAVPLLNKKLPTARDWEAAFRKELSHYQGLRVCRVDDGVETQVLPK